MVPSQRPIFREQALQRYRQRQEKDVLPRLISPPVFFVAWIVLGLCLSLGVLAWLVQVPTFMQASGVVLAADSTGATKNTNATVLIFLPASYVSQVHAGSTTQDQLGASGPSFTASVVRVDAQVLSPDAVRQRYALTGVEALALVEPSITLIVRPTSPLSPQQYAGSLVNAQVQIGSQRVLSLLPVLNNLIGD